MQSRRRPRRLIVGLLVLLTILTSVAAAVSIWARALVLNTDRWTELADRVIREPEVVKALSERLSTSIVEGLDVEERVRNALAAAERLPAQATVLAEPLTARIHDFLESHIAAFVQSDEGRQLWTRINRAAHERIVAVLQGETRPGVTIEGGTVTLNTAVVINGALARAEDLTADIIGKPVSLPSAQELEASGGPDQARALLEERLGVDLPDDFGELVVFRSDRLAAAQDAVRLFDRFIVLIIVVALLFLAACLVLSVDRRRTLVQLGIGILLGAIAARLAIRAVKTAVVDLSPEGARAAVSEVMGNVLSGLVALMTFLIVAGVLVGVAAYLAGRPAWLEGFGVRTDAAARWVRAHTDGLRLAGLLVAVIALYLVALSWVAVVVVLALLGAYQLGISYLAAKVSAPAPRSSAP
jgi:hypothetical protein